MFSLGRQRRQVIRNPWSKRRNTSTATVVSGLAVFVFVILLGMGWLLSQAMQTQTSVVVVPMSAEEVPPRPPPPLRETPPKQQTAKPPPLPQVDKKLQPQQLSIPIDEDQVSKDRPTTIDAFREAFEKRYGPEVSTILREKALKAFGSVESTAHRFLNALAEARPFRLGFAGYSITVGRGNFYHQSYPFVLYHLLEPLLQHNLQLSLTVKNAAIGGIPSFPYGFCLSHFLGPESPDVVSWDYSMNEQGNTAVLESYVRHAQQAFPDTRPLVLALDKHHARCQLLNDYTEKGMLKDALCVAKASEMIPKSILEKDEKEQPPGLQKWTEFGAPKNCPGRGSWHPKKMEHAAIAWTMASYFVDALELAVEQRAAAEADALTFIIDDPLVFPAPLSSKLPENPAAVQSLLYGHANTEDGAEYRMHAVSCRTNFEPAADHDNLLTSIVTAGVVPDATADTILEKRSDAAYAAGWVLDVSQLERDTKIKVDKCGGLGYVDMKMALYGVAASGPLDLWLPVDDSGHENHNHESDDDAEALHWIESLIVCEANEKRPDTACKLTQDLQYTVGGVAVELPVPVLQGAGEYLKRPTCVAVPIPSDAKLTKNSDGAWGLPVRVQAASRVTREGGACCLSHLIWEHALHED